MRFGTISAFPHRVVTRIRRGARVSGLGVAYRLHRGAGGWPMVVPAIRIGRDRRCRIILFCWRTERSDFG